MTQGYTEIQKYLDLSKEQLYTIKFKTNDNFLLRQVADESCLIPIGEATDFDQSIISLNETAAYLWKLFSNGSTIQSAINQTLCDYDESKEIIEYSVVNFVFENVRLKFLHEEEM